jgi:hypothetical protein
MNRLSNGCTLSLSLLVVSHRLPDMWFIQVRELRLFSLSLLDVSYRLKDMSKVF